MRAYRRVIDFRTDPEKVAYYVTPKNEAIHTIIKRAMEYFRRGYPDSGIFLGYNSGRKRVETMVESVYMALQDLGLEYRSCEKPKNRHGQYVRLVDEVLDRRVANCVDASFLMCSCLEALHLHPVLGVNDTHAYIAVWLEDVQGKEPLIRHRNRYLSYFDESRPLWLPVNAVSITGSKSFDEAVESGQEYWEDDKGTFELAMDIHALRKQQGILSMRLHPFDPSQTVFPTRIRKPQQPYSSGRSMHPDERPSSNGIVTQLLLSLTLASLVVEAYCIFADISFLYVLFFATISGISFYQYMEHQTK